MSELKRNVAVIGAGLIGIDLLERIRESQALTCVLVAGRDGQSRGLRRAAEMGYPITTGGISSLMSSDKLFDIIFDASNAALHTRHWTLLRATDTVLIDLTPSSAGTMIVPTVNGSAALHCRHINLISCGGQVAIPLLHAIALHFPLEYIELVSTVASYSAGRATRLNLDEYIETTQLAIREFTGTKRAKVLANLSPAKPAPPFRVTLTALAHKVNLNVIRTIVGKVEAEIRKFAPGFTVTSCDATDGKVLITVEVRASRRSLPRYAGNIEIINSAAVLLAAKDI